VCFLAQVWANFCKKDAKRANFCYKFAQTHINCKKSIDKIVFCNYNIRSGKLACKGLPLRSISNMKCKNLGFYGKTKVLQRIYR